VHQSTKRDTEIGNPKRHFPNSVLVTLNTGERWRRGGQGAYFDERGFVHGRLALQLGAMQAHQQREVGRLISRLVALASPALLRLAVAVCAVRAPLLACVPTTPRVPLSTHNCIRGFLTVGELSRNETANHRHHPIVWKETVRRMQRASRSQLGAFIRPLPNASLAKQAAV